jgi:hypothetical protein
LKDLHIAINENPTHLGSGSAKTAIWSIWIIGLICAASLIAFLANPFKSKEASVKNAVVLEGNSNIEAIDELLLSPGEGFLADEKSFVNGALRFQSTEVNINEPTSRNNIYEDILKKKLQKLPKKETTPTTTTPSNNGGGFSIKPVPH